MNILTALFLILTEALHEGLRAAGHNLAAEIAETVHLAGIALVFFAAINNRIPGRIQVQGLNLLKILIAYFLFRFAIFDTAWNLVAGQNWDFYGTVKLYDRTMTALGSWGWMLKGIAAFWGTAWLLNYRHQAE